MVGAGVWVSIADELPPHLDGHKVWVTTSPTAPPAPVVPERDQVRADHAEWSKATFGSVGPIGPLKHLSKEALEAAAAPGDLSEWADMQFLLWDAQRRAGITDEKITQAMIDKLEVNKARQWPEPKDGEPRPHIQAETDTTSQQFESLARKAVVPEGWKLVPIELTKEMRGKIHPFAEATCLDCGRQVVADCEDNVTASWNDMLAVAPDFREISNSSTKHFRENAESSTNGWIPCSERMPDFYYSCLAADEHGDMVIGLPNNLKVSDRKAFCLSKGELFFATHWQPLPEPPCK
ncbi:DUF550 domain-containing protein [Cronobacter sakazakii]|nr:DUF550 domain-containing protein [Cronobacter sakazakii]